jgi:hypothetical protein
MHPLFDNFAHRSRKNLDKFTNINPGFFPGTLSLKRFFFPAEAIKDNLLDIINTTTKYIY